MAGHKGQVQTRKVKAGPRKGSTASLVTIKDRKGNIKHSYETYSPAAYKKTKKAGKKGHH